MQKIIVCTLFFLFPLFLQAQQSDRYVVFFSDKENNQYNLSEPETFLSARAIERRSRQSIELSLEDLPVSASYLQAIEGAGAKVFYKSRWLNAALLEADSAELQQIRSLPQVDSVVFVAPGSKLRAGQEERKQGNFRIKFPGPPPESIQNQLLGVTQMQEKGFTGKGKLIAVLDGGFKEVDKLPYFSHLFDHGHLVGQHDFTTSGSDVFRYSTHGTKALSTIAAIDSANFIGTAPLAGFLLAITEDVSSEYVVEEYNWLFAAEWADSAGVDVISASLGYNTFDDPRMNYTYQDLDGETTVSARAATMAADRGILVVVSAGNSGSSAWKYIVTPADAKGIVAVGAIREDGSIASFSSLGPTADGRIKPEVVAIGYKTTVADPNGGFTVGNGTSYAAPQIAGFAAAVWQALPDFSSKEIRETILQSGNIASMPDTTYGWGKPYFAWIEKNALPVSVGEEVAGVVKVFPNPVFENSVFVEFDEVPSEEVFISLYTPAGLQLINKQKIEAIYPGQKTFAVHLHDIPKGFFILEIYGAGKSMAHKIVKY